MNLDFIKFEAKFSINLISKYALSSEVEFLESENDNKYWDKHQVSKY